MKKIGIVGCSNGQTLNYENKLEQLSESLKTIGIETVFSDFIYDKKYGVSGTGKERADALTTFYKDDTVEAIFDISGGDLANETLPYLDYGIIENSKKTFYGYSDLTTVINAIYTRTGKASVLYQIRNVLYYDSVNQLDYLRDSICNEGTLLYDISYDFIQGDNLQGIVVGGNLRCLLKLAGTMFWPNMTGKILLLESYGGEVPQIRTYFNHLQQIGVFVQVAGVLLGTFTSFEDKYDDITPADILKEFVREDVPIVVTKNIGHGVDSKAIIIGKEYTFQK